jgi:hypothetical protein
MYIVYTKLYGDDVKSRICEYVTGEKCENTEDLEDVWKKSMKTRL